jgi:hypothetical protein
MPLSCGVMQLSQRVFDIRRMRVRRKWQVSGPDPKRSLGPVGATGSPCPWNEPAFAGGGYVAVDAFLAAMVNA